MAGSKVENPIVTYPNAKDPWGVARLGQTRKVMKNYENSRRQVAEILKLGQDRIDIKINTSEPIRILPFSDQHLFDDNSSEEMWRELVTQLMVPGTYGVVLGDFLQGYNPNIADLVRSAQYDMTGQIRNGRLRLQPLVDKGKILFAVDGYMGHESWTKKLAGLDAIDVLFDGMRQPDGTPVQVVYNNGMAIFSYPNGAKDVWRPAHNSGSGGTTTNPVGAQRKVGAEFSFDDPNYATFVAGGHIHHLAATVTETRVDKRTDKEKSQVLAACGSIQGVNPRTPNPFLLSKGVKTQSPGVATVVMQNGERVRHWATFGYPKSDRLFPAARLWDKAERQGLTNELTEKIIARNGKPKAVFSESNSRPVQRSEDSSVQVPLWEKMHWDVGGMANLPMVVYIMANARFGSTSTDSRKLRGTVEEVVRNPYAFGLIGRHMVDKGVSKRTDRMVILNRMAFSLAPMAKSGQMLGLMLSGSLREEDWKKKKGNSYPVMTGDHLNMISAIKGTPLYANDALIELKMGRVLYTGLAEDHLAGSGSEENPYLGLIRMGGRSRNAIDFVFGGHNPGVGVMSTENTEYIATGWFSRFDSKGKANERHVPVGGQAVILFPDTRMAIGVAEFTTARDMHRALFLGAGLTSAEKQSIMRRTTR